MKKEPGFFFGVLAGLLLAACGGAVEQGGEPVPREQVVQDGGAGDGGFSFDPSTCFACEATGHCPEVVGDLTCRAISDRPWACCVTATSCVCH